MWGSGDDLTWQERRGGCLPFQGHGDDQVRYLDATLLEQTTYERIGFAEHFV